MNQPAKTGDTAPDVELAARAAAGDAAARRLVVERLFARVRATVHYLSPSDRDADDLVQLALIEILRAIGSYRGESRLDVWAYRIVVRTALRQLKKRNLTQPQQEGAGHSARSSCDSPESELALQGLRRRLRYHLERLPVPQRTAIVLRYVHGLEVAEIAHAVEAPFNTVRERLRVAKRKLQETVSKDPALAEWIERSAP